MINNFELSEVIRRALKYLIVGIAVCVGCELYTTRYKIKILKKLQ